MYDLIGNIHGHADELKNLLEKLEYKIVNGVYCHPTRKAFFTGDFVDRGPKIRETLQIVKAMIDNGQALTVMGNHEYNAVCYNIPVDSVDYLRKHNKKNQNQHSATIKQFENHQDEYEAYLQWFRTLPLYYDADDFRVVHACWDAGHIVAIDEKLKSNAYRQNGALTDEFFKDASDKTNGLHGIIEETLKGKECRFPEGRFILDKESNERKEVRIKWWLKPVSQKWHDWSFHPYPELPDGLVDNALIKSGSYYYGEDEKPVFFGHYWCENRPKLYRGNICCVDYSVAKRNKLVAYRFNGEKQLNNDNFVYVESKENPTVVVEKNGKNRQTSL